MTAERHNASFPIPSPSHLGRTVCSHLTTVFRADVFGRFVGSGRPDARSICRSLRCRMKHAFVCLSQISRSRAIGRKRPTRHPNQKSKSDGFPAERVPDVDGDAFLFEDRTTQARFLGRLSVRLPGGWAEKSISRLVFCVRLRVDGCFPLRHIIPPCWDATILQCNGHEGAGEAGWGE